MGKTPTTTTQPRFLPTPWVGHPRRHGERISVPVSFIVDGQEVRTDVAVWKYSADSAGGETPPGSRPAAAAPAITPEADSAGGETPPGSRPAAAAPAITPEADTAGGENPGLLLIHGFRGDHHGMQLIADALAGFEVLVPDLPGYGRTPPVRSASGERVEHTVDLYAAVVEALAQRLGLGPGDALLGHSFGTIVCAAHLAQHQRDWTGLVLGAPVSDDIFRGRLLPGAGVVELYYRLCQLLPGSAGNALLRSRTVLEVMNLTLSVGWDRQLNAFAKDQHRQFFGNYSDRQTLLESYYASSRHTVLDYAQDIHVPTLLAAGAKDTMSTAEGLRALRGALPDGHLEVIRGAGHLVHYEKPAQLARAVRRFLREL